MSDRNSLGDIVGAAKEIYEGGLVQAGEGNVSLRVGDRVLITPTYNDYAGLTGDDIVELDMRGTKLSVGREPSSEYMLHIAAYKARPRAECVIHTHSHYATALSVARIGIPVILEEMLVFLGGPVGVSEYGQANTKALAKRALESMGDVNGTLMANHGTLVCARNALDAIKMAKLVEKMACIYLLASKAGKINKIPEKSWPLFLEKFECGFATY